jgi:hypothetical protein
MFRFDGVPRGTPRIGSTITPRGAASYLIQAASCLTASCVAPTDHTTHGRTSRLDPGVANRRDDHAAV